MTAKAREGGMETYEEEMKSEWWPIMAAVALTRDDWPEVCNDAEAKIKSLKAELAEARAEIARLNEEAIQDAYDRNLSGQD